MSTLTSVFNVGLTGLQAAQTGLKVVSQNIANVNTPGYVRTEANFQSNTLGGDAAGVSVTSITRAADQFLAAAALNAAAASGAAGVRADLLNRAQSAFGDPTSDSSMFAALNTVFSSLNTLASDPTNTLRRSSATGAIQDFLNSMSGVSQQLASLQAQTEDQLGQQAQAAAALISQIADLNKQITVARVNGNDSTSAENAQSALIDQLSSYMDIKVSQQDSGGVTIRTGPGALLVGAEASSIAYTPGANGVAGSLTLIDPNGVSHPLEGLITSGSLAGLMQARDQDLPQLSQALGALAGATADALNAIHNNSSAVPAPSTLSGRDTGLLSADRLGFTGKATLAITDSSGVLQHTIAIDFSAGALSVDGGAATSFGGANASVAQFVSGLNAALGGAGSATFANGALTLSASGGGGLVVQQDAATPSSRGGRGFAQFFGLNDLITRDQPIFFDTGFAAADANGLNAGGALSFQVKDSTGRVVLTRSVAVTGATWADQIAALNSGATGIGGYGAFTLDSNGALNVSAAAGYSVQITGDTTQRGNTGLSMSQLFGLDSASGAGRANDMSLASAIAANPALLALAQPDLGAGIGAQVLETGDAKGAQALAAAATSNIKFAAAGAMTAQTTTLATYASRLGGQAGQMASQASSAQASATATADAANSQRSSVEGVKLDDELVKMTQYQQSYAAASRLIQAAKDMFDMLLSIK